MQTELSYRYATHILTHAGTHTLTHTCTCRVADKLVKVSFPFFHCFPTFLICDLFMQLQGACMSVCVCVLRVGGFFVSFRCVYLTRAKLCRFVAEQVNRSMATTKLFVAQLQSLHTHTDINRYWHTHMHMYNYSMYRNMWVSFQSSLSLWAALRLFLSLPFVLPLLLFAFAFCALQVYIANCAGLCVYVCLCVCVGVYILCSINSIGQMKTNCGY